jgi:hypothetical protein
LTTLNIIFSFQGKFSKKEIFYLPNTSDFQKYYISTVIPDGDWKLYLISKHNNFLYTPIILPGIIGVIFAALFGF